MPPVRVMLIQHETVLPAELLALFTEAPDRFLTDTFADGTIALAMLEPLQPDVLVLDMAVPDSPTDRAAQHCDTADVAPRMLALSAYADAHYIMGLLAQARTRPLTSDTAMALMVEAVRRAWTIPYSVPLDAATAALIRATVREIADGTSWPRRVTRPSPAVQPGPHLYPREWQVLQLMAYDQDNAQIAATLGVAEGTVKNHITRLYARLGVRTRAGAVAWFWRYHLHHGHADTLPHPGTTTDDTS